MKLSASIITGLLAVNASAAFDKYLPWGKRDYYCLNVIQGIPESSTLSPGDNVTIKFNRNPTTHCPSPQTEFQPSGFKLWLVNAPVRDRDTIHFAEDIIVKTGGVEDGEVEFTVPGDLPQVEDESAWYLRLDAALSEAPQYPSVYNAAGPFTITQ